MWFKNAQIYRLLQPLSLSAQRLDEQLANQALRPCSAYDLQSQGWASPQGDDRLVHAIAQQWLLCMATEKRLLPSAVIKQSLEERAKQLEQQQGFKPGRKQLRDLKDQVTDELLPRAFTVRRDTRVWIDVPAQLMVVDAASPGLADEVIALINRSSDALTVERVNTNVSPLSAMTGWLATLEAPQGFTIDQEAELRAPDERKATVRFVRHTLEAGDIQRHLKAGKQCTQLAMTWANRLSFVLTETGLIKRIRPVDIIQENLDAAQEDEGGRFDAEFTLMSGELGNAIKTLFEAMGGVASANA